MKAKKCARCGKRLSDLRIYSRFTRVHYCADVAACAKRARRRGEVAV